MRRYYIDYATLADLDNLIGRMKLYRLSSEPPRLIAVDLYGQTEDIYYYVEYAATDPLTSNSREITYEFA